MAVNGPGTPPRNPSPSPVTAPKGTNPHSFIRKVYPIGSRVKIARVIIITPKIRMSITVSANMNMKLPRIAVGIELKPKYTAIFQLI